MKLTDGRVKRMQMVRLIDTEIERSIAKMLKIDCAYNMFLIMVEFPETAPDVTRTIRFQIRSQVWQSLGPAIQATYNRYMYARDSGFIDE